MTLLRAIVDWSQKKPLPLVRRMRRRMPQLECVEAKQLLAGDLLLGSVYFEEATGDDSAADVFEITFEGGADGTTLDRIVIDGDKTGDGLSAGDVFYDIEAGGLGAFDAVGLTIEQSDGFAVLGVSVVDGTSQIIFDLRGFEAGETLVFSVDADEIQFLDPTSGDVDTNSLVEGAEFQRSTITGQFSAKGFEDQSLDALYWDVYDEHFADAESNTGHNLSLPDDQYDAQHDFSDRTAGAIANVTQTLLPTIAGTVFHDMNLDNLQDPAMDEGIAGVQLQLWRLDAATNEYVDTGMRASTNEQGDYLFEDTGGTGPSATLSFAEGSLEIQAVDQSIANNGTSLQLVAAAGVPAGFPTIQFDSANNTLTISISSTALTRFDDMVRELRQRGFTATNSNPGGAIDPAVDGDVAVTMEGAQTRLLTGTYQVREQQPQPYFSVGARAGTIDGVTVGTVTDVNVISEIVLPRAADSIDNDFAEALPASISGHVFEDDNNNGTLQQDREAGIGGVQVRIVPISTITGTLQSVTVTTDASGFWTSGELVPGEYRVEEVATPAGYVDGLDSAGTINGVTIGRAVNPGDEIIDITLGGGKQGVDYDFGELRLTSLAGRVHLGTDGDCVFDEDDILLADVQIDLLDAAGNIVATTFTSAAGEYLFDDLAPGEYQVREHTPAQYNGRPVFDGDEHVGTAGGAISDNDLISGVVLSPGEHAEDYNFCEHLGAGISGWVYHDENNNGIRDDGEAGIGDVALELLDADSTPTGISVQTSSASGDIGYYEFTDLPAGTWGVQEVQSAGWIDGLDAAGTHGGSAQNPGDRITGAMLNFGDFGQEYNFGELLPAVIGGLVHASRDADCDFTDPDFLLEGVQIDLLDTAGIVVATTFTNVDGRYRFTDVAPGEYQLFEHQPATLDGMQLFDGDEHIGDAGGDLAANDHIRGIVVGSGQTALGYHFCEHIGAMLSGWVYHDHDNDGVRDDGEEGIGGVTVMLLDAQMNPTGQTAVTSSDSSNAGFYKFNDIPPGVYGVMEAHPDGWIDGIDTPGSHGGIAESSPPGDKIHTFELTFGDNATDYNFGELLPGSIRGRIHETIDAFCEPDPTDPPIAGVTVQLLNASGTIIATTQTNSNGEYLFDDLRPGSYSVRELQPDDYFDAGAHAGSGGGSVLNTNLIADVAIASGEALVDYDFCEQPASNLSGYVFIDGAPIITIDSLPDDIFEIRDGQRTSDDTPLAGVVLELRQGRSGDPIFGNEALPGLYAFGQPIRTVTEENGFYEFRGLRGGTYSVVEVQPEGLIDGIDTAGSQGGIAVNPPVFKTDNGSGGGDAAVRLFGERPIGEQRIVDQFRTRFGNDAIVLIGLPIGEESIENNFSEITTQPLVVPPIDPPPPPVAPLIPQPLDVRPPEAVLPQLLPPQVIRPFLGSHYMPGYTWHLSVVNAGFPRSIEHGIVTRGVHQLTGTQFDVSAWRGTPMDRATWTLGNLDGHQPVAHERLVFGNEKAKPVAGDWDGDGTSEVGVFIDGEWFLDVNGDGTWDEQDLWAKLGTQSDIPVVGDWDGDGKTDIGIYGPMWPRDPLAIAAEPGIPDPQNVPLGKMKNVPPDESEATSGERVLKRSAHGDLRVHLIDHVFAYGQNGDIPVTGDFNGDGIATIGVFRGGSWKLDVNGDGRFTRADKEVQFGEPGDLPVVGDFNGDGVDELGVFRNGVWHVDTNRNDALDATDEVYRLGGAGDLPVVGDWDADGKDEPGVYHPNGATERLTQVR